MPNRSKEIPYWRVIVETGAYSVFVGIYLFLVLHFLKAWIKGIYDQHKVIYAIACLFLISIQGIMLEAITSLLLHLPGRKSD